MKRFATLIALAGCSAITVPEPKVETSDLAPQSAAPVTARHGATIELVAATDDGVVLTQDAFGGSRLWLTLDGTREPVVVQLPFASSLVIGRTPKGFVIVTLDEAGGAQIARLDASGRVLARTDIAPDPAVTKVVIHDGKVLAVRADHTLSVFAPTGELLARLEPPAGRRINLVAARNGRVLVLFDRNAAWLDGIQWGKPVEVMFHDSPAMHAAALSPDGTLLALHIADTVEVRDIALGGEQLHVVGGGILQAVFIDNATLGVHRAGSYEWRPIKGGDLRIEAALVAREQSGAWVGDMLVLGAGRSLELREYKRVRYLGYANEQMPLVGVDVSGVLAEAHPLLVNVQRIDDQHVLVTDRNATGWHTLSVIDTTTKFTTQLLNVSVETSEQRYEPSTQLLAVTDSAASYLVRYDSETHKFESWYRIEHEPSNLFVFDPARTHGVIAVAIRSDSDDQPSKVRAEQYTADNLNIGSHITPTVTYAYDGRFLGLDKHNRVYVADGADLVVHYGDLEVVRVRGAITGTRGRIVETSDGFALLDGDTLARFGSDGALRWRVATTARDITLRGNTLYGFFAGSFGRFDLATGALVERSCGTGFGFIPAPNTSGPDEEMICEAP